MVSCENHVKFREFADGAALELGDSTVTIKALQKAGLALPYARAIFDLVQAGKLSEELYLDWMRRLQLPRKANAVKDELGELMNPQAPPVKKRAKRKAAPKTYLLVSRSDHARAEAAAIKAGLKPVPSKQGSDRWQVTAPPKVASALTLTGYWMTADE